MAHSLWWLLYTQTHNSKFHENKSCFFFDTNFVKNKLMEGNGKLELILYQYKSEMSFRATYGISFLWNTLKEPPFSEGRLFELQTSFTYLNFNTQKGPTSLVVKIKYSVSNEINPGLLQATVQMKFLCKITFSGNNARCKSQVSRSVLARATNTNLDHLTCFWRRGSKKIKKETFFLMCFWRSCFPPLQLMVVAEHKVCSDYGLRQCNLVVWATEQYKAWSNSEKIYSKMSTRYSAGKAIISSVVRPIAL